MVVGGVIILRNWERGVYVRVRRRSVWRLFIFIRIFLLMRWRVLYD